MRVPLLLFMVGDLLFVVLAAIAIAVLTILAVSAIAILSVAIIVTVFALLHVNAVEDDGEIVEFTFLVETVDKLNVVLGGNIGSTNVNAGVCHAGNDQCVRYQTYRGCVKQNVVVLFFQVLDGHLKVFFGQQLGGVGRDDAGGKQVEVVVNSRIGNLVKEQLLVVLVADEEGGDAFASIFEVEQFG